MTVEDNVWVERYRPESLDEVVGNNEVVAHFREYADDEEMPNILLAGPQGTGKTALVVALAREIYGDQWRNNLLELNASDERGIDTVRETIKSFAQTDTIGDYPFKLIFLDEVDSTTNEAQSAMRRVMEDYSDKTRFILSCNYPNKIIPPIQSRCAVYSVSRLDDADVRAILDRVIDGEDLEVSDEAFETLVDAASGDARKAINTLQAATLGGDVTAESVTPVVSTIDYGTVQDIIDLALNGAIDDAMDRLDEEVLAAGAGTGAFLEHALSVLRSADIPADSRAKAIERIADADWRIKQGANPHVQLHSLLADVYVARHLSPIKNYEDD